MEATDLPANWGTLSYVVKVDAAVDAVETDVLKPTVRQQV